MPLASKEIAAVGFTNPRGSAVLRETDLYGTDHNQRAYVLRCSPRGAVCGTNGSDIHARRRRACGGGRPGLADGMGPAD